MEALAVDRQSALHAEVWTSNIRMASSTAPVDAPEWNTAATKEDLVTYITQHGSPDFLRENKMTGELKQLAKKHRKDTLVAMVAALSESTLGSAPGYNPCSEHCNSTCVNRPAGALQRPWQVEEGDCLVVVSICQGWLQIGVHVWVPESKCGGKKGK